MKHNLQIMVLIVCALAFLYMIGLLRKNKADLKYTLLWITADAAVVILCFIPNTLNKIAGLLQIYEPLNLIFFLGFLFMAMLIFSVSRIQSEQMAKMTQLAQKLALVQEELEELKRKKGEK